MNRPTSAAAVSFRLACSAGVFALLVAFGISLPAAERLVESAGAELADALSQLTADVFPAEQREELASMVRDDQRGRLQAANDRSRRAWYEIKNREQWEAFRDPILEKLRRSLGDFPDPPKTLDVRVTGRVAGDGYQVENLVFQSRPGVWVTANLYLPAERAAAMPGILICHSHHRPKEHGELQDMGMTWARHGCAVLVMDQLGHGERRQHPFKTAADFAREFRVSRQDYYFRYDVGMQLHLVGDSLMGWMVWDLMRGVDLLVGRPDVDPQKILLLGAVAGGGDPAAVTAALDRRIAAAVPFNFGGPQPETRYPLPDDAEMSFNYAGSGSWESTRNLRRSAADGFLPWVIVGGIAPRQLVFAHEFNWDRPRDPVWRRLQAIYGFYGVPDHLASTHGRGELRGQSPEATHCTHIGAAHRVMIHNAFRQGFDIRVTPDDEFSSRIDEEQLLCMTPDAERQLQPRKLHEVLTGLAVERGAAARGQLDALPPDLRHRQLRERWVRLLGNVEPAGKPRELTASQEPLAGSGVVAQRIALEVEPGIRVPVLLLLPDQVQQTPVPVVVAVSQSGKQSLLAGRADAFTALLREGVAVCLPDLRGIGETRAGNDRGRYAADTSLSSTELMLGGTMVGARLHDLRAVLAYLRGRKEIDPRRMALWGDSLAPANPAETDFQVPRQVDGRPRQSEPLGGLLVQLAALFEEDIQAVYVRGGLSSFQSVLASPYVLIPHDVVVPGVLTAGDLNDLAAALAPRPLRLDSLVDGLNRRLTADQVRAAYQTTTAAYRTAGHENRLQFADDTAPAAEWLIEAIRSE